MNWLKSAIVGAVLASAVASPALAQTALTRTQLETNINSTITSNGIGAITGPILNTQLQNLAASMATTLDPNTFSQQQTGTFIGALTGHASLDLAVSSLGTNVATLLGGASTGTGGTVGSISPTISNPNVTDIAGSTLPALNVTTANHSAFSVVGAQIIANVDYGSFGDGNVTFGFVVGGGKNLDASATTGSWQLFSARYTGFGGGDGSAFITAGQELMNPTLGANNNSGRYFGNNPECLLPAGFTPAECTAEEADIRTAFSATVSDRHGLRIADLGSTGSHATDDTGLSILSASGIGFSNVIELGSQTGQFPGVAGGNLLETAASSAVLASLMDFSNLTGANPGFLFSAGNASLYFGGLSWPGGRLKSATGANGPDIEYGNGFVVINTNGDTFQIAQFGHTASTIDAPLTLLGHLLSASTVPTISACGTGSPAVSGSDTFGKVVTGAGTLTSCVVNFGAAFATAPNCVVSGTSSIAGLDVTTSTTQLTIGGTSLTSVTVTYGCGSVSSLEPANDNATLRAAA